MQIRVGKYPPVLNYQGRMKNADLLIYPGPRACYYNVDPKSYQQMTPLSSLRWPLMNVPESDDI